MAGIKVGVLIKTEKSGIGMVLSDGFVLESRESFA